MTQCEACNGAGELCRICDEIPDNCDCETQDFVECLTCQGNGRKADEDDDEDEEQV